VLCAYAPTSGDEPGSISLIDGSQPQSRSLVHNATGR
jgi:hypothetical protein